MKTNRIVERNVEIAIHDFDGVFYCPVCGHQVVPRHSHEFIETEFHGSTTCDNCGILSVINIKPTGLFCNEPYWSDHIHDFEKIDVSTITMDWFRRLSLEQFGMDVHNKNSVYYRCNVCSEIKQVVFACHK